MSAQGNTAYERCMRDPYCHLLEWWEKRLAQEGEAEYLSWRPRIEREPGNVEYESWGQSTQEAV